LQRGTCEKCIAYEIFSQNLALIADLVRTASPHPPLMFCKN
jgi:hypothetical protein